MTSPPPDPQADRRIDRPHPIDPLLAGRHRSPGADPPRAAPNPRGRQPARGARTVALAASVVSTAALATWIAAGEGAFDVAPGADSGDVAIPGVSSSPSSPAATIAPETAEGAPVSEAPVEDGPVEDGPADATIAAPTTTDAPEPLDPALENGSAEELPVNASATGFADGNYLGSAEYTEWGDVQVEVTIVGGELVDIVAVQIPSGRRSTQINDRAEPILEAAAVAAQDAVVDIVSGATYTSVTYADSLQAALDQAALAASADGVISA